MIKPHIWGWDSVVHGVKKRVIRGTTPAELYQSENRRVTPQKKSHVLYVKSGFLAMDFDE
jgi:hypothetical protein